jgi:Skp family chaperone for outer membrane proteins
MDGPRRQQGALNVKISLIVAAITVSLVALTVVPRLGAQPGAAGRPPMGSMGGGGGQGGGTSVALIDIGYIFKSHIRFKNSMDSLGKDIRATEDTLNKERTVIQKMMERLKDYKPGTPDYKHLEEDIAQKQADFQVKAQIQKREFVEREGALYFKTIQEINEQVKYFSEKNGIGLVMKFNGDATDPNDRDSVMRELNKPVMYYSPGIVISDAILAELNRGQTPNPNQPVVPPLSRKGFGPTGSDTPYQGQRPGVAPMNR